jgi:acetoin utilization protein AcuC
MVDIMSILISYSDAYLNWKLGSGDGSHPTNPVRAKIAVDILKSELPDFEIEIIEPTFEPEDRERLLDVHSALHVSDVLDKGLSYEWDGKSRTNADTAALMFGGTVRLVERMLKSDGPGVRVAFNPQGAKHHAHADYSSGFCVFNDMAWAAREFVRAGKKVVYIDWDAHAGDGVQAILENTETPTFSVHGHGIFPNRADTSVEGQTKNYLYMDDERGWYNYNLQPGEGDDAFLWAVEDICNKVLDYEPDVILLATGADGHEGERWGLKYTLEGYIEAAERVRDLAERLGASVLIGGAGGYQPYTWTPRVWAEVVKTISSGLLDK